MCSDETAYVWSEREYTLPEIYNDGDFPLLIMVSTGYDGEAAWESYSAGDVLWLSSKGSQRRAIARDLSSPVGSLHHNAYYSIPLDYPVPFRMAGEAKTEVSSLQQIVDTHSYPCLVHMVLDKGRKLQLGADQAETLRVDTLDLQDVYSERFFKANALVDGKLHPHVHAIPIYLKEVTVVKAEGLNGPAASQAKWRATEQRFIHSTGDFKFEDVVPTREITIYSKEQVDTSENIYDIIHPSTYTKLCSVPGHTDKYVPLPKNRQTKKPTQKSAKAPSKTSSQKASRSLPRLPAPSPKVPEAKKGGEESSDEDDFYEDIPVSYVKCRQPPVRIQKIGDIPEDIASMGCSQILDCLKLLNMEKYVDGFQRDQVNGGLLKTLDEEMMINELGVTKLHARKLYQFAHGKWRPTD